MSRQDQRKRKDATGHSRKPFSVATLGAVVLALGLGLAALGPAEASIVDVDLDPDVTLNAGKDDIDGYQLSLTPSTDPPVYLAHINQDISGASYILFVESGGVDGWVVGHTVEINYPNPSNVDVATLLGKNELIGTQSQNFIYAGVLGARQFFLIDGLVSLDYRVGEFIMDPDPNAKNFIGFQFEDADGVHYGWMDVSMPADASSLTIYAYAYESEVGVPIAAGAVPLPSSLLLLGTGLAGLGLWVRRRRQS